MFSSIVAGTDGSPTARKAVQVAADLARLTGATLHLVSGYRLPNPLASAYAPGPPPGPAESDAESEVKAMLERTATEISSGGLRVEVYPCARGAVDGILDVAEAQHADLIVVGNRGMYGTRRVLGSVPNSVAHHASCSVLIVDTR